MVDTLTHDEVGEGLPPKWRFEDGEIRRTYEFESYLSGVEFATDVARIADQATHYPRIVIEFRSVTVAFRSQDAGGVTKTDLELAGRVEAI